ncbi:hypothetical protein ABPG77_006556 [Micractinium sp. CCAP 211/92]
MFGTSAEPLTYDAGWSPEFRRLADLVLVAEGRELPTHSQVMARESKARRGLLPSAEAVASAGATALSVMTPLVIPLQLLEGAALAKLGKDCSELEHWRPALEAADGLQNQAPRLYERTLELATAALLNSMRADAVAPVLVQQLLTGDGRAKISPATQARLFAAFASGVRVVAVGSGSNCGWGLISSSLATEGQYHDSFTWTWEPGFGSNDFRAQVAVSSPVFTVGGLDWRLQAYLDGNPGHRGHLAVFLVAPEMRLNARVAVTCSLAVQGQVIGETHRLLGSCSSAGWSRIVSRADLNDPNMGFLVNGALTIPMTVQLSFRRADVPYTEFDEWCWSLICRIATLVCRFFALVLAWAGCAVAFHLAPLWGAPPLGDGGASALSAPPSSA